MNVESEPPNVEQRNRLRKSHWAFMAIVMLLVVGVAATPFVFAEPTVLVGARIENADRLSFDEIDHQAWSNLLAEFVDSDGNVDYERWQRSSSASESLENYLLHLSHANPNIDSTREAKLSFWINAYNAVTIYGILREYPTDSIRNHTPRLYGYNIWHDLRLVMGNEQISLDEMEHEILRPMGEPRIHFAIVCASRSCPRLMQSAFTVDSLEEQLEENAKHFFSLQQNFRFDSSADRFYLSSILNWFRTDFGNDRREQLRTVATWLPEGPARTAALNGESSVSYLDYDWGLNSQNK